LLIPRRYAIPSKAGLALCVIVLILLGLRHAGPARVVNQPQHSDVILTVGWGEDDIRYWKGIELLRSSYAPQMLVDARADAVSYGRTPAELTEDFLRRSLAITRQVSPGYSWSVAAANSGLLSAHVTFSQTSHNATGDSLYRCSRSTGWLTSWTRNRVPSAGCRRATASYIW
jgi:hypothetical protein